MSRLRSDNLPDFDQQVMKLIGIVVNSNQFWGMLNRYGLNDDACQSLYEYIALTNRSRMMNQPEGYLVDRMKNHLRDLLRSDGCRGLRGKNGGIPTEDLWGAVVFVSGCVSDDSSGYDMFDTCKRAASAEPCEHPSSVDFLTQIAEEEATQYLHADADYERLERAVKATSIPKKVLIMGVATREVKARMDSEYRRFVTSIQVRLGRYGN